MTLHVYVLFAVFVCAFAQGQPSCCLVSDNDLDYILQSCECMNDMTIDVRSISFPTAVGNEEIELIAQKITIKAVSHIDLLVCSGCSFLVRGSGAVSVESGTISITCQGLACVVDGTSLHISSVIGLSLTNLVFNGAEEEAEISAYSGTETLNKVEINNYSSVSIIEGNL